MEFILFDHKRVPGSHCFALSGCSEVFHIRGHFCGIIFHFTERLNFPSNGTPSFLSTVHYSQSDHLRTNKQYHFFCEETKELPGRHFKVSTSRTETSIITGHKITTAVIHASVLSPTPASLSGMNQGIAILQQFHEGMCSTSSRSSKHSSRHRTVDTRLKMEAGKDKPANFPEQGFISFFAERHMPIAVCRTAL